MAQTVDIGRHFTDLLREMNVRQLRNALKRAYRAEAKKQLAIAQGYAARTGMRSAAALAKTVYSYVYSRGGGFLVTVKGNKKNDKGMYRNSKGRIKPVMMWAEDGTAARTTKNGGLRRSHSTGNMGKYGFLDKAEAEMFPTAETDLLPEVEAAVEKVAKKVGLA